MRKIFARIMSFIFIASFALLSVGCFGNDSGWHDDLIDKFNRGEITYEQLQEQLKNNMPVPLHGAKVLYRPENYDYDGEGTVGTGNQEYYGQYAWRILDDLERTFGTFSLDETERKEYLNENAETKYFYDTIRYNLYEEKQYTKKYVEIPSGTDTTGKTELNGKYFDEVTGDFDEKELVTIVVDTDNSWNWTFGSFVQPIASIYYNGTNNPPVENTTNTVLANTYGKIDGENLYFSNNEVFYYQRQKEYRLMYLGTESQQAEKDETTGFYTKGYSNYVKALEYVIYCITLDINPGEVKVTLQTDGTPQVKIKQGQEELEVDEALTYIKNIFNKIGTYVGFSETKQAKLVNYILNNVIGKNAIEADYVAQNEYAIYEYKNEAGETVQDLVKIKENAPINVKRDYTNVVANIVEAVSTQVHIGSEEGGNPGITDRFPASYIKDYYGTNFMVASDDPFKNIEAMEYQSVVLMFRDAFTVDNLSLHFKYDAGDDGDDKVTNSAIDIKVYINIYNKGGQRKTVATETIRVKDGPHDYGAEGSTMMLFGLDKETRKGYTINPFTTEMAGGQLHHPDMKYDGTVSRSQPHPLTGTGIAKNYYELVEASNEATNNYYSYGRLNPKAFTASEDCDYLEINFEVLKVIGDYTTNYKFYTGLGVVQ